jgi:hypothetical protein
VAAGADLATNTRLCTVAVWHNPRFFSSSTEGWNSAGGITILWDRLYAAGADLVLNGQQHHYGRLAPMAPDGSRDDTRGIHEFNVGAGGESLELPTALHPNTEVVAAVYGVLKLAL